MVQVDILILLSINFCSKAAVGGVGSPSLMIIACFTEALLFNSPFNINCMGWLKSGMSPIAIRLTIAIIFLRLLKTGATPLVCPSLGSLNFQSHLGPP